MDVGKHILVTGGNGFIGARVVDHLMQRPDVDRVTLFLRPSSQVDRLQKLISPHNSDLYQGRLQTVFGDVREQVSVMHAVQRAQSRFNHTRDALPLTGVVHLAGLLMGDERSVRDVNTRGVMNLVGALALSRPQQPINFVQAGSLTSLGWAAVGQTDRPVSVYAKAKSEARDYLSELRQLDPYGPIVPAVFRPAVVVGAGDMAMKDLFDLAYGGRSFLITGGQNFSLPYVSVESVAQAMSQAATMNSADLRRITRDDQPFYLSDGQHTWEEIASMISEVQHGDPEAVSPLYVPLSAAKALARIQEKVSRSPKITSDKLLDAVIPYQCDGARAQQAFGLTHREVRSALAEQHQSYLDRGVYNQTLPGIAQWGLAQVGGLTSMLANRGWI